MQHVHTNAQVVVLKKIRDHKLWTPAEMGYYGTFKKADCATVVSLRIWGLGGKKKTTLRALHTKGYHRAHNFVVLKLLAMLEKACNKEEHNKWTAEQIVEYEPESHKRDLRKRIHNPSITHETAIYTNEYLTKLLEGYAGDEEQAKKLKECARGIPLQFVLSSDRILPGGVKDKVMSNKCRHLLRFEKDVEHAIETMKHGRRWKSDELEDQETGQREASKLTLESKKKRKQSLVAGEEVVSDVDEDEFDGHEYADKHDNNKRRKVVVVP